MKQKLSFVPLLLLILLVVAGAAAAQESITTTWETEGQNLTVGDPAGLTLAVTHPAGHQVIAPELPAEWGDLVVTSVSAGETTANNDGTETTRFAVDARLFAPGDYQTPPLPVSVTDGSGQLFEVLTAPAPISIQSVLVEGDTDLRDIKPQADMPFLNLLPWLMGGLLVLISVGGAAWWWRRRRARLALAAVDNRLPHEVALDELTRAEKLGWPEQGRFKEHYALISDAVRLYMERTYGVPMMERTTGEIKANLSGRPHPTMPSEAIRDLIYFLNESDLVKFSKAKPTVREAYEAVEKGRQIVERCQRAVEAARRAEERTPPAPPVPEPAVSVNGRIPQAEVHA